MKFWFYFSFLIVPVTSYGNLEPLHLKCSWVDDKILKGVDDNGYVLPKSPLPDIDFQFPKLRKDQGINKITKFLRVDRPETISS